jgi:hypothetical protein
MLIWGFTAGLMTTLLAAGGWDRPWDGTDVQDLDSAWQAAMALRPTDGNLPPANAEVRG